MPQYFFNVMNDVKTEDFEGKTLANLAAAKLEAQNDIVEISHSHFTTLGANWAKWSIDICDKDGVVLLVVPFSSN